MGDLKNQADYSKYRCPFDHLEKDCGHELLGPRDMKILTLFGAPVAFVALFFTWIRGLTRIGDDESVRDVMDWAERLCSGSAVMISVEITKAT